MRRNKRVALKLPSQAASVLMILVTVVWTFWGVAEMYHEGWWGAWYNRLPYVVPIAATLVPTLLAFRWPIVGGAVITLIGVFALFFFGGDVALIGLAIAVVGTLFVVDGFVGRRVDRGEISPPAPWWLHHWRYLLVIGLPLMVFAGVSTVMLPVVLTRVDDGDRTARLIEGNGVALIWAPEGPGWNWRQPWGGYPSWQSVALYGVQPVGLEDKSGYGRQGEGPENVVFATEEDMAQTNLCRYLSADGTTVLDELQNIWRMPTIDEVVRSLGRHGVNAGCRWQGEFRQRVQCDLQPDKESPLWATDQPAIYYWTADAYSKDRSYFVAYNGMINASYKLGGNPRHSYRCVKDP